MDVVAKEAAIGRFLDAYPRAIDAGQGHPALQGCEDVRWSGFPECPAGIPMLLRTLLDREAASEANRALTNSLLDGITAMNVAAPMALPFLLRLADDPRVPARSGLRDLLVTIAEFSESIDAGAEASVLWFGSDSEHPEREQCRAVFAQHAGVVATLAEKLAGPGQRTKLRQATGLP
ncbi:hypothetical protein ACFV1A_21675 [Streptomyces seoulensis]|uniref:hypothetical protein n=1 Tax=Streptomyces seoulensis TaxID=73044 RepID=UPI00103983CD|nr:hypothetical protein [Streptomyces seoulensis]